MRRTVFAGLFLVGLAAVVLAAPSSEPLTQSKEPLSSFTAVNYALPGAITLIEGEEPAITIAATQQQRDALDIAVTDGTLQLRKRRGMGRGLNLEDVAIELVHQPLTSIALSGSGELAAAALATGGSCKLSVAGSGSMAVNELRCEAATLLLAGSGDLELSELVALRAVADISGSGELTVGGTADEQSVSIAGSGEYLAAELVTTAAKVQIAGSGSATLNADARVSGSIVGSGELLYRGTPELAVSVSGSGDITALDKPL